MWPEADKGTRLVAFGGHWMPLSAEMGGRRWKVLHGTEKDTAVAGEILPDGMKWYRVGEMVPASDWWKSPR